MTYGPIQNFTGTIASGASTLTSLDVNKSWSKIAFEIPTMSTAAAIDIYGASDGATFRPLFERVNTTPVQYQTMFVASGVGANGGILSLYPPYPQYFQFRASAVVANGLIIRAICSD